MNQTGCGFILFLLGVMGVAPITGQEAVEVPFHLPTPEGWRTETISFPLDFAPELDYEGLEELRFAPGMFTETKVDFWSYVFVWWVPAGTHFDTDQLQTDLEGYFRGLTTAVAETRSFDPGQPEYHAQLDPVASSTSDHAQWEGEVLTFDVFTTRQPIRLKVRIDTVPCPTQGSVAAFFRLSPQPQSHPIWKVMGEIRQDFRCER